MVKLAYLLNRLTLVILVVLISGCGITGDVVEQKITFVAKDNGGIEGVYFCPRDNCSLKLSEFILSASSSVYCAFFDLDLEDVKNALKEKDEEGVDVKLIVDTDNHDMVEDLDVDIKQDYRSAFMHNKFCIVDGKRISSGSMNPTFNGNSKNNNNLIFISSSVLASNYEDEFFEMWDGEFGKGSGVGVPVVYADGIKIENYFCPEDNCGEKISDVLSSAKESIKFLTFSFTHTSIANEIVMKIHDNVSVKGVFEKRGATTEYSRFKLLDYQGASVRRDNNSAVMHHKLFIIDDSIVITGSFNPSKNADTRNDENILVIYSSDVANRFLEEFDYVFGMSS